MNHTTEQKVSMMQARHWLINWLPKYNDIKNVNPFGAADFSEMVLNNKDWPQPFRIKMTKMMVAPDLLGTNLAPEDAGRILDMLSIWHRCFNDYKECMPEAA